MSEPYVEPETDDGTTAAPALTDPETGDVGEQGDEPGADPSEGSAGVVEAPVAAEGMSERELDKRFAAVERRGKTWAEYVAAFAAETEQPLVRCAVCLDQAPGFHFSPEVVPMSETQIAACRWLAGLPLEPDFPQDPATRACDLCDGWGRVKTGSKVAGQSVVNCPECLGRGFKTSRAAGELHAPALASNGGEPEPVLTESEQSGEDAWGTPRNHPDWGKSPQYRSPTWQAELEAYKRGEPAPTT